MAEIHANSPLDASSSVTNNNNHNNTKKDNPMMMTHSPTPPLHTQHTHTPARCDIIQQSTNNISRTFSPAASLTSSSQPSSDQSFANSSRISHCSAPEDCITLASIVQSFNTGISFDQAWAIIHQAVEIYRNVRQSESDEVSFVVATTLGTLCLHRDGSVHVNQLEPDSLAHESSQRNTLFHLAKIVYQAIHPNGFNPSNDDDQELSVELEDVLKLMTFDDDEIDAENIDDEEDELPGNTIYLDAVLVKCCERIQPNPRNHYRAVCRALVAECKELQSFLVQTLQSNALLKFEFSDWRRFWVQVVAELRQGVSLKKHNYSRPALVFELTPFEILMEDIRSRNFELRKVLVNGDRPKSVKSDAHEVILEFIRSRPPLRSVTERKLAPLRVNPTPREQLLDSIRDKPRLRHIEPPEVRPLASIEWTMASSKQTQASQRRIIPVDMSLFDDDIDDEIWSADTLLVNAAATIQDDELFDTGVVHRKKKKDTQPQDKDEDDQPAMRRHTIVGCHRNDDLPSATPSPRPDSRLSQSSTHNTHHTTTTTTTINPLNPCNTMTDEALAEWTTDSIDLEAVATVADGPENSSDRLALSLEEIVHIRSVMTKAELEALPVGVHVKEEVERKKVCFLCLRTRFKWYGQRGVQCKLCQRIVCSKCYSKIRIPTEHFRNVPVMLLSASLMASPVSASSVHTLPTRIHTDRSDDDDDNNLKAHHLHRHHYHHHLHHNNQHVVGSAPTTPRKYTGSTPGSTHYTNGNLNDVVHGNAMTMSTGGLPLSISRILDVHHESIVDGVAPHGGYRMGTGESIMTRSMEGPHSLPPQSPAAVRSQCNTLDRQARFARSSGRNSLPGNHGLSSDLQTDTLRAELASVCIDCQRLVDEIIRSSKQTRSSARNKALRKMTLDLSPVYKGG